MIFATPILDDAERAVLALIASQRDTLRHYVTHQPRRWFGTMRRNTFARAIQGSNSIEGYNASVDEAIKIIEGEPPLDERTETWYALKGYRDAMTYIIQTTTDSTFEFGKQFIKSLHFMMISHEINKNPGQWRPSSIYVVNQSNNQKVYEGPPPESVDALITELVQELRSDREEPNIICAAMAHLNFTMIHPFKDGNGRMARALQTLILARDGVLHPVFSSIEEWLGRNTQEYYSVLAEVGKGGWHPGNDARPWIRFCLKAHYQQAATLIRRNEEYEALYERISELVKKENLNDRTTMPLFDAALGMQLTRSRYKTDAEVNEVIATRDLRKLSEIELLDPEGEKRGRVYKGSKLLRSLRDETRIRKPMEDPFQLLETTGQEQIPQGLEAETPRFPGF